MLEESKNFSKIKNDKDEPKFSLEELDHKLFSEPIIRLGLQILSEITYEGVTFIKMFGDTCYQLKINAELAIVKEYCTKLNKQFPLSEEDKIFSKGLGAFHVRGDNIVTSLALFIRVCMAVIMEKHPDASTVLLDAIIANYHNAQELSFTNKIEFNITMSSTFAECIDFLKQLTGQTFELRNMRLQSESYQADLIISSRKSFDDWKFMKEVTNNACFLSKTVPRELAMQLVNMLKEQFLPLLEKNLNFKSGHVVSCLRKLGKSGRGIGLLNSNINPGYCRIGILGFALICSLDAVSQNAYNSLKRYTSQYQQETNVKGEVEHILTFTESQVSKDLKTDVAATEIKNSETDLSRLSQAIEPLISNTFESTVSLTSFESSKDKTNISYDKESDLSSVSKTNVETHVETHVERTGLKEDTSKSV